MYRNPFFPSTLHLLRIEHRSAVLEASTGYAILPALVTVEKEEGIMLTFDPRSFGSMVLRGSLCGGQ